ncbi:endonuclease/exonuclease/phosphatase family protein [Brevundimonas pondensis]|uniref:endonuclease/exonuclease/phosphatase family protein n=1 Tax=Brevundimonas pondensis TaxID=2774189 RepID=UPI001CECB415|nr:endonuclease/exonuclease/phosphatase family protein [Brevundimonas pondensis]
MISPLKAVVHLAALGLVAAPAAVALSALSGIGHRWTDLLAQFVAPALAATLVLTVICALLKLRPAMIAGLGVTALLILAVWPQWLPRGGALPREGAPTLTLYSANLWAWNSDVDAITRSIQESDADIVVLVELGDAPSAQLDRVLAGYPHRVLNARVDRPSGAARAAIASRYPLTAVADRADGLVSVAAVAQTPLGSVNIIGAHLTRPWPFQYQWGQINQAAALAAIRHDMTGPVIAAGDFNSVSSARIGRQIQAEAGLIPAPGWPGTWPSAAPSVVGMTIDQVWRSPDLALLDRKLGRKTGSDHRPVITRFTLAAEAP